MRGCMDLVVRSAVLFLFFLLCDISRTKMAPSKSYSLARSCKSLTFKDEYSSKLRLYINLTGAVVMSHDDYLSDSFYNGIYPETLSCELVAEVRAGSKIMLVIESLHIPTESSLCDENYLYVFDYESSRSKAMVAAGGEKGLCGHTYPKSPIITTGPFITLVFNSRVKTNKVPHDAGFLLTLTEVIPIDKNSICGSESYGCGHIVSAPASSDREKRTTGNQLRGERRFISRVTMDGRTIPRIPKNAAFYYCIPRSLVCDGVKNCHDGSDEDSSEKKVCSDMQKSGVINKFLSLGLSVSITIAVSCIIVLTLCMGITVCYCVRLCTSESIQRQPQGNKNMYEDSQYQGMMIAPSSQGGYRDRYHSSNFVMQPPGFMSTRESSSASSLDTDKMYYMYQDPLKVGYMNVGRPASEKLCHWGNSSLLSYPSNSEGHHSHPETPYFTRDLNRNDLSPRHPELIYRPQLTSARGHHNSYNHHTPTSSRSAKSTKSTKSSNVDKKNAQANESKVVHNTSNSKYPLGLEDTKIVVLGPILGQV